MRIDDAELVSREYGSLDRTGWLRFDDLDEEQTLIRAVAEVHPTRVLDVGCGDGRLPSLYAAPEVVAVDSSPDATELPFPDGSFDVVTCSHMLYHVPDPDGALAEFVRVLRPGGRFAGIYDSGGSVLWLTQRDLQTYLDAYVGLYGPMLAPDGPYPFTATRAKCVFVADAA
jgi:ubiquinone/menaquinone biosynthesis C-methylase UbiE